MSGLQEHQRSMLRAIPAIHRLVELPRIEQLRRREGASYELTVSAAQQVTDELRQSILADAIYIEATQTLEELLCERLEQQIYAFLTPKLRRVINGTGVVLHTNLGRALLSEAAAKQAMETAMYYSNLEYDIEHGSRGSRHSHVEEILCKLTGAESAMVVNNNAAAVYLILRELASGKEVIVSRGQLVEIGGSFRVSEIMAESGAKLVEVGTSNKTHLYDYEKAITEQTALLLKVHTSNFKTIGFTSEVPIQDLVALGNEHGIPVYEDLGSGVLYDLQVHGIGDEPIVQKVLQSGVDLVSFSGDKLLGGPQAGIIAGKKKWIDRLKRNQLARMLRVDKMTLAGLEATLRAYLFPEQARKEIPTLRDILATSEEIEDRVRQFVALFTANDQVELNVIDDESAVGGGTLPGLTLPTKSVALQCHGLAAHHLEEKLRRSTPPVIVRIVKDQVRIDFRTIQPEEVALVAGAVQQALYSDPVDSSA
jgi:L-seryl-tRNA(Ser) seleniumtransferase